ncbi:MAG: hypothetical protein M3295_03715 [Chloroflexota bacterium]|nr:hypothetical protein [Chloroflexota bacterium]
MTWVRRISAYAELGDQEAAVRGALERARSGDPSWGEWLTDYETGAALVVRVAVEVEFDGEEGVGTFGIDEPEVWVQKSGHIPEVEAQVQELVPKTFHAIADEFARRSLAVRANELDRMYVHVGLGEDLLDVLFLAPTEPRTPGS